MRYLDQGAEATISVDDNAVVKDRTEKAYRLKEIDDKLRKARTKREAKVLTRLEELNFPAPKMLEMCDKAMQIRMELVNGNKLRDVLYKNHLSLSEEIGQKIGILHSNEIIHGDLTTSNMILDKEIKFIDFGLSFFSSKDEDKAVDLHLLRQALESKHHDIWEDCFKSALKGYKETHSGYDLVFDRLEQVEARGRHKSKF